MAKGKFGALAEFRLTQGNQEEEGDKTTAPPISDIPTQLPKGKGRPAGKRSNPDYEPTTVLLRKLTKKKASRLLEDTESEYDLSDLIETLLGEWISAHS